jgi:hypothetical protein
LLVPRAVRRGTSQAVARVGLQGRQDVVQPGRSDECPTFQQDENMRIARGHQAVKAGRRTEWFHGAVLLQVVEGYQDSLCGLVRTIRQEEEFYGRCGMRLEARKRCL